MGFTVPAVQYSALATLPPELTSSKSQHSIAHTTNVRVILNQILKKLLNNNNNIIHNEQTITTELSNKIPADLSENIDNKENDVSIVSKNPNNNSSGHQISIEKEPMKSIPSSLIEPLERLPFSEPYLSKPRRIPLELSTYHKHCIHQEKYIDQKQYHPLLKQIKPNSSLSSYIKENCSNLANFRLKNSTNQKSESTTTLPISTSIEKTNTTKTNYGIRSSYTQRLRRLQSRSKIHSKTSPISSSIAHRIELLKKAMHNPELEIHDFKTDKSLSSNSTFDSIHKQTQTNNDPLKSSDIHHIHHHHIHSSSSFEWRTYLSILGTFFIIFLLLIELITIIF